MKVFLDSSVVIAGIAFRGSAHALLTESFATTHEFLISEDVRDEAVRVLQEAFPRHAAEAREVVGLLRAGVVPRAEYAARLVDFPGVRDPSDAHVLAAACTRACRLLVSWDKDILILRKVAGCEIVGPPEPLRRLRAD